MEGIEMKLHKGLLIALSCSLLVGSILLINACSRQENASLTGIKIGATVPLTGDLAAWGNRQKNGILLALEEVNAQRDAANQFHLSLEDTKSQPAAGVSAIKKLIDMEKVKFVIGDVSSGITLAMAPIAEENKVLLLSPGASNPALTNAGDYIFRNWISDVYDGAALATAAKNELGAKKVLVLHEDNTYSEGLADTFVAKAQEIGLAILDKDKVSSKNTDYRTLLEKYRDLGADLVFVAAHPGLSARLFLQMEELGMTQLRMGSVAIQGPEFLEAYPNASDIYFTTIPLDKETNEEFRKFSEKYNQRYGEEPDVAAAHAYDAVKMYAAVIPDASTTVEQAKDGLYNLRDYHGATGIMSFDSNGDVQKSLALMKYEQGKARLEKMLPAE